jgi:hypothetical protein
MLGVSPLTKDSRPSVVRDSGASPLGTHHRSEVLAARLHDKRGSDGSGLSTDVLERRRAERRGVRERAERS